MRFSHLFLTLVGLGIAVGGIYVAFEFMPAPVLSYPATETPNVAQVEPPAPTPPPEPPATHVKTPSAVKAIYMTSFVAGDKKWRESLVKMVDETELNSIVIDIKDYTGNIAFHINDPVLEKEGSFENRIPDVKEFLADLHARGIYVIGRIASFQDPAFVKKFPETAVKENVDRTKIWADRKGQTWTDPGSPDTWNYLVTLAKESYELGFDEINFDYIRFPSDGDMENIYFPYSEGKVKAEVIREFFAYVDRELSSTGIVTSADLFGMTTTNYDDLNIGQVLEYGLEHFDYVAPMVYPSHYPANFMGFRNPAEKPYEVVKYSMDKAVERASTSPLQLRPWLQDFSLGATYTAEMVRAQIKATYDSGLTSWMLWNASNRYTRDALLSETDRPE